MIRVAVFGASGFLGATLVERAMSWEAHRIRPIIHGSGGAARLARHGVELHMADLLAPETIGEALSDCTHVVNCSRGPAAVMTKGLSNLLDASLKAGVRRFVHISSVAVYGERARGVIDETAAPAALPGSYGAMKLAQDEMVARAASKGLSSVILCPPNISGPHSPFLLEIVGALRNHTFALVDDGRLPCELVDVENLVHAIRPALQARDADARRIFVTDGDAVSWRELAYALAPLGDRLAPLPGVSLEDAERRVAATVPPRPSLLRAMKHLTSSKVRETLRPDPWFSQTERRVKTAIKHLPRLERFLRQHAGGNGAPRTPRAGVRYLERLLRMQLRDVRYSTARAARVLGYTPAVPFSSSMRAFQAWYEESVGWNDEWWPLVRHLYMQSDAGGSRRTPTAD